MIYSLDFRWIWFTKNGIPSASEAIGKLKYNLIWVGLSRIRNRTLLLTYVDRKECLSLIGLHAEKSFRNLIKSNRNQFVFTIFRLICNQTDVRLIPNQSENGKYNLISGCLDKIWKRFFSVQGEHQYSSHVSFVIQIESLICAARGIIARALHTGKYFPNLV